MPFGGLLSAGISGGASILGGIFGKNAADKASQQQAALDQQAADVAKQAATNAQAGVSQAAATTNPTLTQLYNSQVKNLLPYLGAGQQGLGQLTAAIAPGGSLSQQFSFNPTDLVNDPGYKFQLQQGMDAIQNAASVTGSTGGTLKELENYAQGLAGTTYNNAYQRALGTFQTNRNNTLQQLLALTGVGQTGTSQFNQATQNTGASLAQLAQWAAGTSGAFGLQGAQIVGQDLTNKGNAQAAGTVGAANAVASGLGGVANAAQGYATNQNLNGLYNGLITANAPPISANIDFSSLPTSIPQGNFGVPSPPVVNPPISFSNTSGYQQL